MAAMTDAEVSDFLDSRAAWLVLTTNGPDGYPHSVPLGYFREDGDIYMTGRAGTQKFRNIERDPRVGLMAEVGQSMPELKGVLIRGDAELITEPQRTLELSRTFAASRGTPADKLPTEPDPMRVFARITPRRVSSWDYSKDA